MFNFSGRRKETWTCRAVPWRRCCNVWWVFKREWQKLSRSYQNVSTICNNNLLVEIIYILLFIYLLRGRANTQNVSFRDSLQWSIHKFTSSTQLLKLNYLLYYPSNAAFSFRDSLQWPVQKLTLSTQLLKPNCLVTFPQQCSFQL